MNKEEWKIYAKVKEIKCPACRRKRLYELDFIWIKYGETFSDHTCELKTTTT